MGAIEELAEVLGRASAGVAFTGAGISTESGIPDFRSPGGVWSRQKPVMYQDFVRLRSERVRYWQMRRESWPQMRDAEPNDGHRVLAGLEERGLLHGVITQNIDGLHQLAGSVKVLELHGTVRTVGCIGCDRDYDPDEIQQRLEAGEEEILCDACGDPLKSRTVSFGEALPQDVLEDSIRLAAASDVFLAIGSSLVVEPAASLPRLASESGAFLAILNRDPTPLDSIADLVIRDPIRPTLAAVGERIEER
jgi:NAD-dependent deacetylase